MVFSAFLAELRAEGSAPTTIDCYAAGIGWWANHSGRADPRNAAGVAEIRSGARRSRQPTQKAADLSLPDVVSMLGQVHSTLWSSSRLREMDGGLVEKRFRAQLLMSLHLGARFGDVQHLRMADVSRRSDCWRVVPWSRKNWAGGTPDGLWLRSTTSALLDPVQAMDSWMRERKTINADGFVFCNLQHGEWKPDAAVPLGAWNGELKELAAAPRGVVGIRE